MEVLEKSVTCTYLLCKLALWASLFLGALLPQSNDGRLQSKSKSPSPARGGEYLASRTAEGCPTEQRSMLLLASAMAVLLPDIAIAEEIELQI